ncbi:MAG: sigma-54 interaction domain-containing protein [Gemmatimonas sp.]
MARTTKQAATAHQALPELAAYLEGLPEPHILVDDRYRILAANAAYRSEFSPTTSVVGRTCYEVSHHFSVPCDQAGETCPRARLVESLRRERVLHLHHTPQGEAYVNIELTPLRDARGKYSLFVEKMEPLRIAQGIPAGRGLIGRSAPFRQMIEMIARVGPSEASVLLLGESGTGKELVATAIHEASPRASQPLVVVDCASMPESLFESELFGHEKGAFTGAHAAKPGLVEAANGGTLFLDEVGDIPLPMQVKLLRLLESGTYRRVGSTELRRTDVRLVSATHRDLETMVAEARFRDDLYYRLSTFPISLPPLRERSADIPLLAAALLTRIAPDRRLSLAPAALARLEHYAFPGNVRELRNVLERATLLCDGNMISGAIMERALAIRPARRMSPSPRPGPNSATAAPTEAPSRPQLKDAETEALRTALLGHRGSRRELADSLGVSLRTLYRKLRELKAES